MAKHVRKITDDVISAVEDGFLSWETVAKASLKYLSEDQVEEMARDNDWSIFPDEDEEDTFLWESKLEEEKNNNKGAKIASIIASALNKQGGHGPMGNEEIVADENTITLVSQAGSETYKFNNDGSVDNLSIDDMIKTMLEDGDIEEDEIEDVREEYSHFNSIKDLLESNLTWFMRLRLPEKLIIKKVEEILDDEKDLEETRSKGQKLDKFFKEDNLCPECGKELGEDGRCYNAYCDDYDPLSQYFDDGEDEDAVSEDFFGAAEGTEKADDILFALQAITGNPKLTYKEARELYKDKDAERALAYVKTNGLNKHTYFEEDE